MPVEIVDETGCEDALAGAAADAAEAILAIVARSDAELAVVLVGDDRMRELNRQWRGKDATTDVLSFSQIEGDPVPVSATDDDRFAAPPMLGDVVVSSDTLRRQAESGGWTETEELVRLLLHGVLHLLGYDHESDADARVMRAREAEVVAALSQRGVACAWEDA